jgi:4-amino-4-deoxy-L-arabinose transferase-like glycosyltransferase
MPRPTRAAGVARQRAVDTVGTALTVTTPAETGPPATTTASADQLGWVLVVGLVVVRLLLSWHSIRLPGLQQDETLFVNAATLRIPGLNTFKAVHGIPLMIFPYIGALKSWLYDPLFAVFGHSPTVVRIPVVLLVSAGLLLIHPAVRDLVNRPVALLAVAALCFDNSVFWLTRDDVGPSAIEFALKCAALFCAMRFARRPRVRWLLALLVLLALGVFNKLNFIWIVNAATVVSILVAMAHRRLLRERWRLIAVWVGGLAVIYACFAVYYFHYNIRALETGNSLTQPWVQFEQGTSRILSGTWFYDYALGPLGTRTVVVWIVLALFAGGAIASFAVRRLRSPAVAYLALTTVLISLQTLFTLNATAGWHYVAIYPFVTVVAAYGVYALAAALTTRGAIIGAAVGTAAVVAVAYSGVLMAKYFDALPHEPSNAAWSPAVYALSDDLQHTKATIFTADWGIFNPLFTLHPGHEYAELAFELESPSPAAAAAVASQVAATPGPKLVVTHVDSALQFADANRDLFSALARHLQLVSIVSGPGHVPVYAIYRYQ